MTKSTITREQLLEIIETDHVQCGEASYLARMALAAMDSEPVIVVGDDGGDALSYRRLIQSFEPGTKLYRHAQQPVVPGGWKMVPIDATREMIDAARRAEEDGYDAMHKAMLAAAPHDTPALNSVQSVDSVADRWIPVSERMPPSRHEVLVGRWWGEKPRWRCKWATYIPGYPDSQSSGWLIPGASWTPTHWMPLPAAPQEPSLACISKRSQHLS